jgi:hypothetical protein
LLKSNHPGALTPDPSAEFVDHGMRWGFDGWIADGISAARFSKI